MKSTLKLIRRFLLILILSIFLLLVLNLLLVFAVGAKNMGNQSPWGAAEDLAAALARQEDGSYRLSPQGAELLDKSGAWAVLVEDKSGAVLWHSNNLPEEIPLQYSLSALSWAIRGYIQDYPTTVSGYGDDLLILGHPKTSLWKLMWNTFDYDMVANLPRTFLLFLVSNIALLLLIYLAVTSGVLRSVKPIVRGVEALPDGGDVYVKEKGLFSQLAASINRASERLRDQEYRLKKKDTARANWISGVSHDIRTPLSMVMGYASQLEESPALPAGEQKKAGIIRLQSIRMKNLINDLNLASKLEYNAQPLNRKPALLVSLLRGIVADFLNMDPDSRYPIEWTADSASATCLAEVDEGLLRRAVSNLILNAQVHNPEGCSISVQFRAEGTRCRISIGDDGVGVTQEQLESLQSSPHYMVCDSSANGQRHGLGLLIVKQIAEAHGGELEMDHSPEGGFLAAIRLPISGYAQPKHPEGESEPEG